MSELAYTTAIALAMRIRQREISSREAVDYFLARVEALDPRINSVVTIDAEQARTEPMWLTPILRAVSSVGRSMVSL